MAQYHYVIYFDEETKEWIHDCDTESIRFDGDTIWNEEEQNWENVFTHDGIWKDKQEEVDLILHDGLTFLNRISAVNHLRPRSQ